MFGALPRIPFARALQGTKNIIGILVKEIIDNSNTKKIMTSRALDAINIIRKYKSKYSTIHIGVTSTQHFLMEHAIYFSFFTDIKF